MAATLRSRDRLLSPNHLILLIADQELARKQCQQRAAQLQAVKARFPQADYYRFSPRSPVRMGQSESATHRPKRPSSGNDPIDPQR